MSEITITVRDATRAIHARTHASRVDDLVAALSADPETIEELQAALRRYLHAHSEREFFRIWQSGVDAEPWDAGVCIIDLAARLIAVNSTYSQPGLRGGVTIRVDDDREEMVPYHLAEEWLITEDCNHWETVAHARRRRFMASSPLDGRAVLYGRVCEFIAEECARQVMAGAGTGENEPWQTISRIHALWLTTPRDDLRGQAPRDVLLERRDHISSDLEDRCHYWSLLGAAPPPLSRESAAYRVGGFGTHEIVLYYYLVRHLVEECWSRVSGWAQPFADDACVAEARWLEELRETWLHSPEYETVHGRTPWSVIDKERIRMPEAMSGAEAMIDHDCPLCQMMADSPSPMFWHLDGCNFDDEFAFSFHRTQKEWDDERREWDEMSRKFDEQRAQKKTSQALWQRSCSNPNSFGVSPELAVFGLASHLTELTEDLKDADASAETIDELNRCFGNLRDVVNPPNTALIEPVTERMCDALAAVADERPALADKSADLARQLREFGSRMLHPRFDEDIPF